ncbi:GNAT family N-acetyltransferase [Nocardioides sp. C4-1]|uniref:GNAT family N-acetyltransferase n=1 Tax=Nocardioides sp. C4-1 TaxID=3151851 RepID=UPI003263131E
MRATLPDRPGTLAVLAHECGKAGVNILALQVFPDDEQVTDELDVRTPEGWGPDDVVDLLHRAAATDVLVLPCTEEARLDQPTRYVEAARAVLADPASFPHVVARLFDADVRPGDAPEDVMELQVDDVQVQVRRVSPFTAVERARGAAVAALVGDVLDRERRASVPRGAAAMGRGVDPAYVVDGGRVTTLADGVAIGFARVTPTGEPGLSAIEIEVDRAHQRRGIGTRLLGTAARLARGAGAEQVVLTTAHDNRAVLPMVLAAGLRGRIRMSGDVLTVRIVVSGLRPLKG